MIISSRSFIVRDANGMDENNLSIAFAETYPEVQADDLFKRLLSNAETINRVIEINGSIAGFVTAAPMTESIAKMDIFISPNYQRVGLGSALFNDMKSNLSKHGFASMCWETGSDNKKATSFYKKLGAGNGTQWKKDRLFYQMKIKE